MSERKSTPSGGPAFPVVPGENSRYLRPSSGMSVREYFAGQALAGGNFDPQAAPKEIAKRCFELADAMIAESWGQP